MLGAVADYAREEQPAIWRRYLTIIIDGLRAAPGQTKPLRPDALTPDEIDQAMQSWQPHHR